MLTIRNLGEHIAKAIDGEDRALCAEVNTFIRARDYCPTETLRIVRIMRPALGADHWADLIGEAADGRA